MAALSLQDVPTPAAILDEARFSANCARMIARARALGVGLRAHMKTLKSVDAARRAIDPSHGGIAVATLNEAAWFIDAGISDVCLAVCVSPGKLDRVAALAERSDLSIFIDSPRAAEAIVRHGGAFRVWIEIDSGEHRTGVLPQDDRLLEIAGLMAGQPGVELVGVATHAGHSYGAASLAEIVRIAEAERLAVVTAAGRLRGAGHRVDHVSVGSTPTALHAERLDGVTEIRAGVYMAGDMVQVGLRSLSLDEAAFSVLASVISQRPELGQVVIDAGGLALSKDAGDGAHGYGRVLDVDGRPSLGPCRVSGVHQEHGEIRGLSAEQLRLLPVGAKVRVVPNHVCMTAAMYDELLLTRDDGVVTDRWPRTNGWR